MPARDDRGVAASIRARLLELSRQRVVENQVVLSEFAIERLLYRIGASSHANRFVLKGAMLFKLWSEERRRATWDLDLHSRGTNAVSDVVAIIRQLCAIHADDGIMFDAESAVGEEIRAADEYQGVRVRLEARLGDARIPVQVDVGFSDAIVPAPRRRRYPTLLGHAAPHVLAYPRETVVAEKCEAMISLGLTNSRLKDFYDVQLIASASAFRGPLLVRAIRATFERRKTPLPVRVPLVLTSSFLADPARTAQWRAFVRRGRIGAPPDTKVLAVSLRRFLWPVLKAASNVEPWPATWRPGGPWRTDG